MALQTYDDLQSSIKTWLDRDDLTDSELEDFISLAEGRLRKDERVRTPRLTTLSVNSEEEDLPDDFHSVMEIAHSGSTYYGGLENATLGELEVLNDRHGGTGVPEAFAVIGDNRLRFAPIPDGTYTLQFLYWRTVPTLSDTKVSNWLLEDHPDIYLFAALAETAPFLWNDERSQLWESKLENAIAKLDDMIEKQRWSGPIKKAAPEFTP